MEIKKASYSHLVERSVDDKTNTATTYKNESLKVGLLLRKPDLLGNCPWQFVWDKNISAKIEDKEFLDRFHKREIKALYEGVRIPCILRIEYDLDDRLEPLGQTRYFITQVIGSIIEPADNATPSLFE